MAKTVSIRFDFFDDGPPVATLEAVEPPNQMTLEGANGGYAETAAQLTGAIVADLDMERARLNDKD
jgi:hypothetical protein